MAWIGDGFSTSNMPSFSGMPKKLKFPPVGLYGSTAGVRLTDQSLQPMRPQPIYGNGAGMSLDQTKLAPNWSMPKASQILNATASKPPTFNTPSGDGYGRIENVRAAGRGVPVENFDISRETVGGLRKEPLISGATSYTNIKPIDFIDLRKRRLIQQGTSMPLFRGGSSYSAPEQDAPVNTGTRWVR